MSTHANKQKHAIESNKEQQQQTKQNKVTHQKNKMKTETKPLSPVLTPYYPLPATPNDHEPSPAHHHTPTQLQQQALAARQHHQEEEEQQQQEHKKETQIKPLSPVLTPYYPLPATLSDHEPEPTHHHTPTELQQQALAARQHHKEQQELEQVINMSAAMATSIAQASPQNQGSLQEVSAIGSFTLPSAAMTEARNEFEQSQTANVTETTLMPCTTVNKSSSVESICQKQRVCAKAIRRAVRRISDQASVVNAATKKMMSQLHTPTPPTVRQASTNELQLVRTSTFPLQQYGTATWTRTYTIKVANMGSNKSVFIRGYDAQGKYRELHAQFSWSGGDNFEIWAARWDHGSGFQNFKVCMLLPDAQLEVVDDNNGANYVDFEEPGIQLHGDMRVRRWTGDVLVGVTNPTLGIGAHVQNLSYEKSVKVVYTTDKWKTQHTAELMFQACEQFGAGYITCPNAYGVEYWQVTLTFPTGTQEVEYAIKYECAGEEFWDNNWGANYKAKAAYSMF